jgi:hypothetical protein
MVAMRELGPTEAAPVLTHYITKVPLTRSFFGVTLRRARALFEEARGAIIARDAAAPRLVEDGLREIEAAVAALQSAQAVRERTERLMQALRVLAKPTKGGTS